MRKTKKYLLFLEANQQESILYKEMEASLGAVFLPCETIILSEGIQFKLKNNLTFSLNALSAFILKQNINGVCFLDTFSVLELKRRLIDWSLNTHLRVNICFHAPEGFWKIRRAFIDDYFSSPNTQPSIEMLSRCFADQKIFITGAAGSIGSEILRQVLHYSPKEVIAIDQGESGLYDIEMELLHSRPNHHLITRFVVADVTQTERLDQIFSKWQPDIIFHAAAYKHVPLMEAHPYEAVKVNVLGTKRLADFALQYNVKKFVMVSTDKAVNPTNVMGASKRLAEMYVQNLNCKGASTQFITTRFGNVLGSNGSVIPLFRKQIERGGPITITHPEITRYFMTIPEACNLVLEAGAMGKGGEIYVFDMGESVKIIDLAKNMIRLSGLTLGKDIDIKFTGLRPGEKLYEELLATNEKTRPTHHEKILIADVRSVDHEQLEYIIDGLKMAMKSGDPGEIVRLMKTMVKEFKSNNSEYSRLD